MAGRPDTEVVTIFNWRGTAPDVQTTYDAKCGFSTADEAVHARREENEAALALLNATSIDVNMADMQYGGARMEDEFVKNRVLGLLDKDADYEFMIAPFGLAHPDHEQTTNVALMLAAELDIPLYLWEDLPLRVVDPELVVTRKYQVETEHGVELELIKLGDGPIAHKIRALMCYKSQIGTGILDPYLLFVPERFYKVL